MMNSKQIAIATMSVAFAASMASAHLPSFYDATMQSNLHLISKDGKGRASTFKKYGAWSDTVEYKGDYTTVQGDTVSHGEFNGKKLWWWCKFAAKGKEFTPGQFAPEGGTSPWVLINSLSAVASGTSTYKWAGYKGDMEKMTGLAAKVPTWRDGAVGAYSMTHDDIGAMEFEKCVQPAWDVAKDYPEIKQCWGVYVEKMSDWEKAKQMVIEGHEMFNHSMRHTSAADQWQWFLPNKKIPFHDPAIPVELRGLTVEGVWKIKVEGADYTKGNKASTMMNIDFSKAVSATIDTAANSNQGNAQVPLILKSSTNEWSNEGDPKAVFYNQYVEITSSVDWTGLSPQGKTESTVGITNIKILDPEVKEITLKSGQKQYVKYTKPVDMSEDGIQEGILVATGIGWYEITDLLKDYKNWYNGYWMKTTWDPNANGGQGDDTGPDAQVSAADKGRSGFVGKVWCVKAWDKAKGDYKDNVDDARDAINKYLYENVVTAGEHFRKGKRVEYYGYPFDAYSEVTHDYLEEAGNVGARGGAKSGRPLPGDFFHPYRIDFDAFYITQTDWDVNKSDAKYIYPENPHVLLGANQMVDEIIRTKGYMIREFHAVPNIKDGAWYSEETSENWPINSAAQGQGGWWGGITKDMLKRHYDYIQSKIDANEITVYTVGEVTKYRMTANEAQKSGVTIKENGGKYVITPNTLADIKEKYRDEISVIISVPNAITKTIDWNKKKAGDFNVAYSDGSSPRRRPRQLDAAGKIWSISMDPYLGAVTIDPAGSWTGQGEETAINSEKNSMIKSAGVKFAGILNGQVSLNLPAGNYTAELYSVNGRQISSVSVAGTNGITATGLNTQNLGAGIFFLNVKSKGASVMQHKLIIK